MRFAPAALCLFLALAAILAAGQVNIRDDFSRYPDGSEPGGPWVAEGFMWTVKSGKLHARCPFSAALRLKDEAYYRRVRIEATVTVNERLSRNWNVVGVAIEHERGRRWQAALVEAPESRNHEHFFELGMGLPGRWPVRDGWKIVQWDDTPGTNWQYGRPYRITLDLRPGRVEAMLKDARTGQVLSRRVVELRPPAVMEGAPRLRCSGFDATFDDVLIAASDAAGRPKPQQVRREYPPVNVRTIPQIRGRKTGFFHVEQIDGVWWVIAPNGQGFYALGTDHCRYTGHWCEKLGYAPYGRVTKKLYGSEEKWAEVATRRLLSWNFNLLGAGHSASARYRGLAHTEFLSMGSIFAGFDPLVEKVHWTGFPNVFSPAWPKWCDKRAREMCLPKRDDPWLFGYFLDNELEWWGKGHRPWSLADEAAKLPADNPAKQAWINLLRRKYRTVARLNKAWGSNFKSWDQMLRLTEIDGPNTDRVHADKYEFVALVAEKYFSECAKAIRRYDPNHMILGCRFAGDAPPGVWEAAGRWCDIVTFNYYGRVDVDRELPVGEPERWTEYYRKCRRPLMITEWSFPALDSGLPCQHGAGMRVAIQQQRARCYEVYQRMIFSLPFMVGSDFFMWVDEPALGISSTFPEDTNYGLVNEQDQPYELLVRTAQRVNRMAYKIHSATGPEVSTKVEIVDGNLAVLVRNTGKSLARFTLRVLVNGRRRASRQVQLAAGEAKLLGFGSVNEGDYAVAIADPSRRLPERNFHDNTDSAPWAPPRWKPAELAGARATRVALIAAGPLPIPEGSVALLKADWLRRFGPPEAIGPHLVAVARSRRLPCQLLPWQDGWRLAISLPALAAHDGLVVAVGLTDETAGPWSFDAKAAAAWKATSGDLALQGDESGEVIGAILWRGTYMARLNPLIHMAVAGQELWVPADGFVRASVCTGQVGAAVEMIVRKAGPKAITEVNQKTGQYAPMQAAPEPFTVCHRILVPRQGGWARVQFAWLRNDGDRPMEVRDWFYFLRSAIGGDAENDEVGGPRVPNFFVPLGAWADPDRNLTVGLAVAPRPVIHCYFWKDPGGGQHPDLRREFSPPLILKPGETYREPDAPPAFIFAGPDELETWNSASDRARATAPATVQWLR